VGTDRHYTTQLQAGLGMIQETLDLLRIWEPGVRPSPFAEQVVAAGVFARATARRTRNLVTEMFAPRYLANNGDVAKNLKGLIERGFPHDALVQLFYLQTANSQHIFSDFVTEVYWPKYTAGARVLTKDDSVRFIHQALDAGKMQKRWSQTTIKRVSGYLLGCCKDFGLLSNGGRQEHAIQRFTIRNEVALYMAYELHFAGVSDMGVIENHKWHLFGMDRNDIIRLLKTLGNDRHFVIQNSADLVQISWTYKTIEECLNVLTQR
jgi:hypothetical protein